MNVFISSIPIDSLIFKLIVKWFKPPKEFMVIFSNLFTSSLLDISSLDILFISLSSKKLILFIIIFRHLMIVRIDIQITPTISEYFKIGRKWLSFEQIVLRIIIPIIIKSIVLFKLLKLSKPFFIWKFLFM